MSCSASRWRARHGRARPSPRSSRELRRARSVAAQAALAAGSRLAALGTSPLAVEPTLSSSERYREMGRRFGLTVSEELTCGCHVHVAVDSDEEGVGALDRIRPWLAPAARADRELALLAGRRLRIRELPHPGVAALAVGGTVRALRLAGRLPRHRAGDDRHGDPARPRDGLLRRPALGAAPHAGGPRRRRVPRRRRRGAARRPGPGAGRDGRAGLADRCARGPGAAGAAAAGGVAGGPFGRRRHAARPLHVAPRAGRGRARAAGHARHPGAGGRGRPRTRCASGSPRCCAAARGRGRSAGRRTRRRRWRWPCAGPQRTSAELCLPDRSRILRTASQISPTTTSPSTT